MNVGKTAPDQPWDEKAEAVLRQLWAEGLSLTAIGAKMGRGKSSISGKAHRMNLPPRPSPILGVVGARKAPPPRVKAYSNNTLEVLQKPPGAAAGAVAPQPAVRPVIVAPPPEARFPLPVVGPARACCWPFGDPRTKAFRFCEAPSAAGRSYCPEHCAKAYVIRPVRSAEEAAAHAVEALQAGAMRADARGRLANGPFVGLL